MSKIGKRIKSVILKGKTFWNWKKEGNIDITIPVPKDYRDKITYETNVELIFNREVLAKFTYNKIDQIPALLDIIPAGYKLLYENDTVIQPFNNNRFVLVYDYYDLIVHYRNTSDINTDIKVFKGRYQYGTLITANMIDWPESKSGKEEWIEFPIGELTPTRVTDRYVYFTNGASGSNPSIPSVSEDMKNDTVIQLIVRRVGEEYNSTSQLSVLPGYINDEYLQKYIKGRLPLGVNPNSDFSVDIRKGSVNSIDITAKIKRIHKLPQVYYVDSDTNIRLIQYKHNDDNKTRFEIAPIIWYDESDPVFDIFKNGTIEELKTFFDNHITRMRNEFTSGDIIPNGAYTDIFSSTSKIMSIINNGYKVFNANNMSPFIYAMAKDIFDFKEENSHLAVLNIGEVLYNLERRYPEPLKSYYYTRMFSVNTDVVNDKFTYKRIENFTYEGKTADLLFYLVPLRRMKYIGSYIRNKDGTIYKNYFSNMSSSNPIVDSSLINNMYYSMLNENTMIHDGLKKTGYRELKSAVGLTNYEGFKSAEGSNFSVTGGEYITKYIHVHKPSETNGILMRNASRISSLYPIDETSILYVHKKNSTAIADDVTQKYKIHFFDENGLEMKNYYTEQIIKEGSAPNPYPPRGYIVDPNKPWTRNPADNKEIYVYLIKKICRVIVKANVYNPNNIKNKYWNAIIGEHILLDTIKYVGEKINPSALLEAFKNTHSAKLKSVQIEDNVYNTMTELEIEDNVTITFNFKVFKADTMKSVLKLSEARKEFGIINPYFDYSLVAILVKEEALKPIEVFDAEEKTRTNNLVRVKSDVSSIHTDRLEGYIESDIIYNSKYINNFNEYDSIENIPIGIKVYTIKNSIKTLRFEKDNVSLYNLKLDRSLSEPFTGNNSVISKYEETVSNIAEFLIEDTDNINDRDLFRIIYANSPDFISEGIDVEIEVYWDSDLLDYRCDNKYPIDIRLLPSALIPLKNVSSHFEFLYKELSNVDTSHGSSSIGYHSYGDLHQFSDTLSYDYCMERYKSNNGINERVRELIKATNIEMAAGTREFMIRPWSLRQILPRPIPIFWLEGSMIDDNILPDHENEIMYVLTQANKDRSKVFTDKVIHNCITNMFTEPSDKELLSNDSVILYPAPDTGTKAILNNTIYKINHPNLDTIILYHTQARNESSEGGTNPAYGTTSIEDWFKIMIEYPDLDPNTRIARYIDTYPLMIFGVSYYSYIHEVHNDSKGYKLVDFSYVKIDTEHQYINGALNEQGIKYRYIFHPKLSDKRIENGNISFVRNYLEDGRVIRSYISSDAYVVKTTEDSAYKGYLKSKSKFVEYVVREIMYASKLHDYKEFYFISAGLFKSKSDAINDSSDPNKFDKCGDIYDIYKNVKGYKDLVDKGEIIKYPADKKVFDKDSVIKLIYSGNDYHDISDIRHLKWHAIEEDNNTIVLDFERKYALDFVTPYSRSIIIPDLDKLIDYTFDKDEHHRFFISDSAVWIEPVVSIVGNENSEEMLYHPETSPDKLNTNRIMAGYALNNHKISQLGRSARFDVSYIASRLYYALLMHDIYNNKTDDGHAVKQELYNPDDIIKYKYIRYPDNVAIDKFVNIHMYNNTVVSSDNEIAVHLKASRYDYRFHPFSIHVKIFGYNIYDLLFKITSIFDLHSNEPNIEQMDYTNRKYNMVHRLKLDKDVAERLGRRFNYCMGIDMEQEYSYIQNDGKKNYMKDTGKQLKIIAPNIYHNFGMPDVNKYSNYINTGDIYRPVIFNDEDIQGLNFKNSTTDTFYTEQDRTFMNHSSGDDKYKLINPYTLIERNDKTSTGITFEDIFRKAWDPYTGHRFTGKNKLSSFDLSSFFITNYLEHYADPYNITTNWILRVSKNIVHYGGSWYDNTVVTNPGFIYNNLNLTEQGIPQDPISAGRDRYNAVNESNPAVINQWDRRGNAVAEHPMDIRYICHPFQRTCLILIRLVTDNSSAGNTNIDTIALPVYMGYVNIRYEEINKRKHDINLLKEYIKECALREDSGYKYYLKNFKYPYIFNYTNNKLFEFDVLENDPLDIKVTYVENHDKTNPNYKFSAEFVLRAHIIREDVKKQSNADICDNKALQYNGSNAIIEYVVDLKLLGAIRNRLGNGNLSNEEFYDGISFLSTHSLERIEAAPKYNIPEYFVHKYSIFNGVKRFGWSAYNGQYLPKWPAFIPDNITMLVSQNLLLVNDIVNKAYLDYYPNHKPLRILNTNIMMHPNFIGGIKDRKNEYVQFDSTKFYGSINIADVTEDDSFNNANPKLRGFEYYSNKFYDTIKLAKEHLIPTETTASGMAIPIYHIKYAIDTISNNGNKWFKQKSYAQIHEVFMHKEEYSKDSIHSTVSSNTSPQEYLNMTYDRLQQPSLQSKGVSNFNLWDDNSSIGFRLDLNPSAIDIVYPSARSSPTAIQWTIPMVYRRDNDTDFYRQKEYWSAKKNYKTNEIAFNVDATKTWFIDYKPWK